MDASFLIQIVLVIAFITNAAWSHLLIVNLLLSFTLKEDKDLVQFYEASQHRTWPKNYLLNE